MTRRRITAAAVAYGLLAALAVAWGFAAGRPLPVAHPAPWWPLEGPARFAVAVIVALAVAAVVVLGTRVLVRRTLWARKLHGDFRQLLGPLQPAEIAFFALSSGIAEELFFRGAMQPTVGIIASSLVFGVVHIGPGRRFWVWTAWACVMGFVFAGLFQLTGTLLAPALAHVLINYENMHFIDAYDPAPIENGRGVTAPGLVSNRLRSGGRAR